MDRNIPDKLKHAIEQEIEGINFQKLASARETLTERYQTAHLNHKKFMTHHVEKASYLATRFPATYAAVSHVLSQIPDPSVKSLLDLGAGPGTAAFAACDRFNDLKKITLIEQDQCLISYGKSLALKSGYEVITKGSWILQNLKKLKEAPSADLVIFSYSIGELPKDVIQPLIETCFKGECRYLVIVEPGTPAGFERIRNIRDHLLKIGAFPLAPCPHAFSCPMNEGNWCHFSERVSRTSLHRRMKGASMGHEDEKFSYFIAAKTPAGLPGARVLRHPLKRSGHVILNLCTQDGLKNETISKKTPDLYKQAQKLDWGSAF